MRIYPPPGEANPSDDKDSPAVAGKPARPVMKNPFARSRAVLRPVGPAKPVDATDKPVVDKSE